MNETNAEQPNRKIIGYVDRDNGIRGPGFIKWKEPVFDNEHNDDPLTFAEACRDEEIAKKDARIAELERRVEELTEENARLIADRKQWMGAATITNQNQ